MMPALHPDFLRIPITHRALHDRAAGRPENSRAAVRAAVAAGYGIEIDVQPSSDGMAMVFHDYDLRRLTGVPGRVAGKTAAELAATQLLDAEDGIPTLREVLAIVAGKVPLLIEIKDQDGAMGTSVGRLHEAMVVAMEGYQGPVAVMSFNPNSVAAFHHVAPRIAVGLTTSAYRAKDWPLLPAATRDRLREIPDYDRVGASFISHEQSDLASPRVAELRAKGAGVLCWTVRSAEVEAAARRYADNITFEHYLAAFPA